MSNSLLEQTKNELSPVLVDKVSNYVNESRGNTSQAITGALPLLLAFLNKKVQSEQGAQQVYDLAQGFEQSGLFLADSFLRVFEQNKHALLGKGNTCILELLRGKEEQVFDRLAEYANISKEAASGVLAVVFPLILSELGKQIASAGIEAQGLAALFSQEKEVFEAAIPSGLHSLASRLGVQSQKFESVVQPQSIKSTILPKVESKTSSAPGLPASRESRGSKSLLWLLLILILAIAGYFVYQSFFAKEEIQKPIAPLRSETFGIDKNGVIVDNDLVPLLSVDGDTLNVKNGTLEVTPENFILLNGNYVYNSNGDAIKVDTTLVVTPKSLIVGVYDEATGNFIYDLGPEIEIPLKNGTKLKVGESSVENKLYKFLNDDNATVSEDKTQGWITLDRIYFEKGKSSLTPESKQQLKNLVLILKDYPKAKIKLGGYTDNAGAQEVNQPLSNERAQAAMRTMVLLGLKKERVSAEGYGAAHFVCATNDTPACMAQNRRVDLRVVEK
uniref:OmpA family protein n=1 Tax=Ornithobacterium rhinotracheale TaxID=28251 RepID=UPI0039A4FECB